jgi:hypothetical protein
MVAEVFVEEEILVEVGEEEGKVEVLVLWVHHLPPGSLYNLLHSDLLFLPLQRAQVLLQYLAPCTVQ